MSNKTIEAVLRLSAKMGDTRALRLLQREMKAIDSRALSISRRAVTFQNSWSAAAKSIGPLIAAYGIGRSVKEFAAMERQLTRTGLTAGATREEMAALRTDMERAGKKYALPVAELMETMDAYAASGADLKAMRTDVDGLAAAQQALGASGSDVVASWDAAKKSLGLASNEAKLFFGIVGAGSQAGKFESRDLAQYLPGLLPSASKQGFAGTAGATQLVAFLEVARDYTGSAEQAATATSDLLEKLNSPDVIRKMAKAGRDWRKDLEAGQKAGEDYFVTLNRTLTALTGGDATRLGEFFGDKEARAAADVVLRRLDLIRAAQDKVAANAPTIIDRNNAALLNDSAAALTRISDSLNKLQNAGGKFLVQSGVVDAVDGFSNLLDYDAAVNAGLEKTGAAKGWWARTQWGLTHSPSEKDFMKQIGDGSLVANYQLYANSRREAEIFAGTPDFVPVPTSAPARKKRKATSGDRGELQLPTDGPVPLTREQAEFELEYYRQMEEQRKKAAQNWEDNKEAVIGRARLDANRTSSQSRGERGEAIGRVINLGADENYAAFVEAAADLPNKFDTMLSGMDKVATDLRRGGEDAGGSISDAADRLLAAGRQVAAEIASALARGVTVRMPNVLGVGGLPVASGNKGQSMPNAGRATGAQL